MDGGASWKTNGGAGGGLNGLTNREHSKPGTQTSGYKFGIGQDGYGVGSSDGVAGSGGGYYGGTTSDYADECEAGAGGSSFVSGYDGCNAIFEETTGYYKIECIGAKGGKSKNNGNVGADGGNGGYTSGIIYLAKGEKIYVYVGGHGADAVVGKDSLGGYNGGGLGTWDHSDDESAGARRRSNRY